MTTQSADLREPRLAALAGNERVEPQDPHAPLEPVALGIAFSEPRQVGSDLDKIGGRKLRALSQRQPDCADARADVDDPALASAPAAATSRAASVPTRWPRLG